MPKCDDRTKPAGARLPAALPLVLAGANGEIGDWLRQEFFVGPRAAVPLVAPSGLSAELRCRFITGAAKDFRDTPVRRRAFFLNDAIHAIVAVWLLRIDRSRPAL